MLSFSSTLSRLIAIAITSSVIGLTLTACSDDGRPNVAEETAAPTATTDDTAVPSSFEPCAPGDRRECKKYWRDAVNNIPHCMTAQQICSASGTWLECGATP